MSNDASLPIVDRTRLDLITRNQPELATEFLHALVDEATPMIAALQRAIAGNDRSAVRDLAHTLKGMAAEVGAARLRAAAAVLESENDPAGWSAEIEGAAAALVDLRSLCGP